MSAQGELWKVSTVEGIFEADLETLKQWIVEGCVLPTDKVTKGSMNWIEAGKAPMLRGAFNGEVGSTTVAVVTTDASAQTSNSGPPAYEAAPEYPVEESEAEPPPYEAAPDLRSAASQASTCHNHPDVDAKYICRVCGEVFCKDCPRFIGTSSVPLCPLCGDLCRELGQERERVQRQIFRTTPFGLEDLARALKYPWQNIIPLLFGALLYGFLLLAGTPGRICASVMLFGCIAHVINQVAYGKLEGSFMPDFSEFSLWDDLIVKGFLGVGITIVTWGPMIAVILIFIFGAVSSRPTTPISYSPPPEYSREAPGARGASAAEPVSAGESEDREEAPAESPGQGAPEKSRPGFAKANPLGDYLTTFIKLGLIMLPFLIVSFLWGVFYYPMALTVAGYTEQFSAVVNPLVGLDTIKRMGSTYFKAFGMVILIQVVGFIATIFLQIIFLPFNMPIVGNLPAKFVDGGVTFYLNLVIACILGLALHKCADRLAINYD